MLVAVLELPCVQLAHYRELIDRLMQWRVGTPWILRLDPVSCWLNHWGA